MQDLQSDYDSYLEEYTQRTDAAMATYDVGRQNTLAAIQQNTLDSQRQAKAQQAFSGMGNTSFGGAQVAGIGLQGAMQQGMVEEQYAAGMAQMQQGQAAGIVGLQQNRAGLTAELGSQYASGLAGMQQNFASQGANLAMQGHGQYLNLQTAPLNQVYAGQMQSAQIPTGMGMLGSALGGIGSGLIGGMMV